MSACRHTPDEHARIGRMRVHAHTIAEHRSTGERARRVHGDHADLQSGLTNLRDQTIDQRALACTWCAGHANQKRATGLRVDPAHQLPAGVAIIFHE